MKQRDYIEELIRKNIDRLNDNEPRSGHLDRFEAKLKKSHKTRTYYLNVVWKVAAAAIFVFLVVNQAIIWISSDNNKGDNISAEHFMTLASISPEYEEVEFFYTNAINVELRQWEKMVKDGLVSEREQQMMNKELDEFEKVFEKLQNDLSTGPNDERVINAILEYYQTKLSLINMIIEKLQEVKHKSTKDHEASMNFLDQKVHKS